MTTNSAVYKEDGKYAKLPECPICGEKVHFHEDDNNFESWSFAGSPYGGDMMHDHCATKEIPTENGEYWNGTEMVEA